MKRSSGGIFRSSLPVLGRSADLARRMAQNHARPPNAAPPSPSPSHAHHLIPDRGAAISGGGPLKTSACTGASVTVPETTAIGAFGTGGPVESAVLSLARTTAGVCGVASFSAPMLAEAGGGLVSLTRWANWGAGCAGAEGTSGCFVAETSSCARSVSAVAGGMSLVVVVGRETAQPASESKSTRRRALGTAREEPGAARKLAAWARFPHPNWASEGARSPV